MDENIKTRKSLSRFGKIWIFVSVMALVISVALAVILSWNTYNTYIVNHEHDSFCSNHYCWAESWTIQPGAYIFQILCSSYAFILYIGAVIPNLVMMLLTLTRRTSNEEKTAAFANVWFSLLLFFLLLLCLPVLQGGWSAYTLSTLISLVTLILLMVLWICFRKKIRFPGKWIALSFVPIMPIYLYFFFYTITVFVIHIASIVIAIVLWILYGQSLKKAPKEVDATFPVPFPMDDDEQIATERHLNSALPVLFILVGIAGIIMGIDRLSWYYGGDAGVWFIVGGLVLLLIGCFIIRLCKIHLYVTNKRVFLKAPLANRINLPLKRISAVATGPFHALRITTCAGILGQINLIFVPKYLEVYDTINTLLCQVQ